MKSELRRGIAKLEATFWVVNSEVGRARGQHGRIIPIRVKTTSEGALFTNSNWAKLLNDIIKGSDGIVDIKFVRVDENGTITLETAPNVLYMEQARKVAERFLDRLETAVQPFSYDDFAPFRSTGFTTAQAMALPSSAMFVADGSNWG